MKGNENIACLDDAVHDGDIGARDFIYCDVACMVAFTCGVGEEKKVAAIECWFH